MRSFLTIAALSSALAAQAPNSILPRGDQKLNSTPGVATTNGLGGFGNFMVSAPKQLIRASGNTVATSQVAYCAYVDGNGQGDVVIDFRRSEDGGRSWGAPQSVYTLDIANGESLATGGTQIELASWGNEVYVVFLTNRDDLPLNGGVNDQGVYAIGSRDRGQTWSSPFRVTLTQGTAGGQDDIDDLRAISAQDGLHLCYEYDTPSSTSESLSYAKLSFDALGELQFAVAETTISTFPVGTADVDNPSMDVEGQVVHIAWNDNAGGPNDCYSITSLDGGVTFTAPFNHTNGPASLDGNSHAAVDGGYVYTFSEHTLDQVYMDRGDVDVVAGTVTWNVSQVPATDAQADIDNYIATVENGIVAIFYEDQRNGSNDSFFSIDNNAGDDFIAGIYKDSALGLEDPVLYDLDVCGDMIIASWEECSFPEGAAIAISSDRGESFTYTHFTSQDSCFGGNYDVDDVYVALTLNGDYVVIYADERDQPGNNDFEGVYMTGGKYPFLIDGTLTNNTLELMGAPVSTSATGFAILMASLGDMGTQLPELGGIVNDYGAFVGLDNDVLFQVSLNEVPATAQSIALDGSALWTDFPVGSGVPVQPFSQLLGVDIYLAAGVVDLSRTDIWAAFTDPVIVGK